MKKILLLFISISYISCDAPIRDRNPYAAPSTFGNTPTPAVNVSGDTPAPATDDTTTTTDTTTPPSDDTATVKLGFENCTLGFDRNINTVGNFGVCQSSLDESTFKTKFANTDTVVGTCFVPIHVNTDGSSYHLGTAECVHHQANKEYDFRLSKDRSENINGVMVVRAKALNPYLQCMTAKMQFINNYANCSYNAQCIAAANDWAAQVCRSFTQTYTGNYLQIDL